MLETVTLPAAADPAPASVIWLHGLGADGNDFVPIVPELQLPPARAPRFLFPHAPIRPVTINMGMQMRAWYDIAGLDKALTEEDEDGIRASAEAVGALVDAEIAAGVPADKIVLAGFSQGGAIALHTALRYPQALAGVMALSTYLPLREQVADELADANRQIPILQCHGQHDPVVPEALGAFSRELLGKLGYAVRWKSYPMQHQVCIEEIADIRDWLLDVLA